MKTLIRNLSGIDLVMTDHYPAAEAFNGGIAYSIPAAGKLTIQSTVFRDQTIEHGEIQDILVKRKDGREMTPLVMSHVDFYNNRGSELQLVMAADGVLSHRFVIRDGNGRRRSLPQIIWKKISFIFHGPPRLETTDQNDVVQVAAAAENGECAQGRLDCPLLL